MELIGNLYGCFTIGCFTHYFHVGLRIDDESQSVTDNRLVIRKHYSNSPAVIHYELLRPGLKYVHFLT
jgi:hypothetical protein